MSSRNGFAGLLLPDETSRRAFEETLADWREEASQATSAGRSLRCHVSGATATLRVIAGIALAQGRTATVGRIIGRTLLLAALTGLSWAAIIMPLVRDAQLSRGIDPWLYGLVLAAQTTTVAFSCFLAAGVGLRRAQKLPMFGAVAFAVLVMGLAAMVLAPLTAEFYRQSLAAAQAAGLTVPPLVRLSFANRLSRVAAAVTFLVLGEAIRRRFQDRVHYAAAQGLALSAALGISLLGLPLRLLIASEAKGLSTRMTWMTAEAWFELAVTWSLTFALLRTRNQTREPGTLNPAP